MGDTDDKIVTTQPQDWICVCLPSQTKHLCHLLDHESKPSINFMYCTLMTSNPCVTSLTNQALYRHSGIPAENAMMCKIPLTIKKRCKKSPQLQFQVADETFKNNELYFNHIYVFLKEVLVYPNMCITHHKSGH